MSLLLSTRVAGELSNRGRLNTLSVLNEEAFEQAVQAILHASHIEFYGIGSSVPLALDAYYHFLRIGLPVAVVMDSHMQVVSAAQLPPGSVAFAMSHTGRTTETLQALQEARGAGACCILLSSYAHIPLGAYAHI